MQSPSTRRPSLQSGVSSQKWASVHLQPLCYRDEMCSSHIPLLSSGYQCQGFSA